MDNKKKYLALFSLSLTGGAIYTLPFLKYVFYDQMIAVMNITNAQLGFMMTLYSIGQIILYIPGGMLADRISSKKSIIVSLVLTSILGCILAMTLNIFVANIVWLLFSLTTAFVFWCSLMKAIAVVGGEDDSGKMYGLYYGGAGLIRGGCNAIALYVFTKFLDPAIGMRFAIITLSLLNLVSALMVWKFYEDNEGSQQSSTEKFNFKLAKELLKDSSVWLLSICILCAYTLYSTVSYFTPYLSDVIGISSNLTSTISIIRTNLLLLIGAPLGGYIVDKLKSTSKWFMIGGTVSAILFGIIIIMPVSVNPVLSVALTLVIAGVSYMIYGVGFSIVTECRFPTEVTATVIGISSIIGFLPDMYIHSVCGMLMDNFGGVGFKYIFVILLVTSLVCVVSSFIINKTLKKKSEQNIKV